MKKIISLILLFLLASVLVEDARDNYVASTADDINSVLCHNIDDDIDANIAFTSNSLLLTELKSNGEVGVDSDNCALNKSDDSSSTGCNSGNIDNDLNTISHSKAYSILASTSNDCFVSCPFRTYFSDVEIPSFNTTIQLLASRLQRSYISHFTLSLKELVRFLSLRADVLSVQSSKLFDSNAFYRCQPVCEYYIFTLRHIII